MFLCCDHPCCLYCPLYSEARVLHRCVRDKWFSTIDLQWGTEQKSSTNPTQYLQLEAIRFTPSWIIPVPVIHQTQSAFWFKTPFLGYLTYRVTEVERVYCLDDKVENCRQENRKQKWNFGWNAFISILHTDHITAPECGFSTLSLLSSLISVVRLPK